MLKALLQLLGVSVSAFPYKRSSARPFASATMTSFAMNQIGSFLHSCAPRDIFSDCALEL